MDALIRFGLSIEEIKNMMDANILIDGSSTDILEKLIDILREIGCSSLQIKNILITNPFYLNRTNLEVASLIDTLREMNFTNLDVVFDTNPFLLNFDGDEIKNIALDKKNEGLSDIELRDFIVYELI